MDGLRKIFLESGQQKVSTTRRAREIAYSLWQIDGFNKPYAISHMPYANCSEASERNEVDGLFQQAL
jgi:hypothetical protein